MYSGRIKVLVSGADSGLGKFLSQEFNSDIVTRSVPIELNKKYDLIIHCASSSSINIEFDNFHKYVEDNILLTKKMLNVPHKKFIFLSTIDIYSDRESCKEIDKVKLNNDKDLYVVTKLMSESLVNNYGKSPVILRASAMLGKGMRENSLLRMSKSLTCNLSLTRESSFNYILYEDVYQIIKLCAINGLEGTYNMASKDNVSLGEIADFFGFNDINFGNFYYKTGDIDTEKIMKIYPKIGKRSIDVVSLFFKDIGVIKK